MPHVTEKAHPPFPSNVPTVKLNKISLKKLQDNAPESAALFDACRTYGFFLLDLQDCDAGEQLLKDVETAFAMGEELWAMPLKEKKKYSLKFGTAFG